MIKLISPGFLRHPSHTRILHWTTAVLLLGMLTSGVLMVRMDDANVWKYERLYVWHQWFGILAMLLINIRLFARLRTRLPALPETISARVKTAARIAHRMLYALMLAIPVMGWIMSSAYPESQGMNFFGLALPRLVNANAGIYEAAKLMHWTLAYAFIALITLHVAAAVKHRFFDQPENDVLRRMV
jgi:cytochrome b561